MALQNQWVTYLDRSYKNIKSSILTRMQTLVPEMTDQSETNIFVIIISIFAGLVEQLNYYLDNLAREFYVTTARRYSSMIDLVKLIDYRVRAKIAASTDIKITAIDVSGDPVNLVNNFTFSAGLIVKDIAGVEFITTGKITLLASTSNVTVGIRQATQIINSNIGTTDSSPDQTFQLADDYEHDTLQITINSQTWELRQTFAYSGPVDKHFIVLVNENKEAWVVFGDDVNGAIPSTGQTVFATFFETNGLNGNVEADTIDTWDSAPTPPVQVPAIASFILTNPLKTSGGLDEEDIERIRKHAPLSLRTLDRAVTYQDHKDIAELVPGVAKAAVSLDLNSKQINIYLAPEEGGTASGALITSVEDEFLIKGMIGTTVNAVAAGETILRMTMVITAKFRRDATETEDDIIDALIQGFGFNNSDVNKQIRKSDIIALIDNLDKVDYLNLGILTTKPYPRISQGSNSLENNWYITINAENIVIIRWRLIVTDSGTRTAKLFQKVGSSNEVYDSEFTYDISDPGSTNQDSSGGEISIGMWGAFTNGDEWIFYSYPYNEDIEFEDFTIPVIEVTELDITVNEQIIA